MFQYSLGRHLSIKYNTELYLDLSWYGTEYNKNAGYPREFKLDKLNTRYKVIDHKSIYWKLKCTDKFSNINPFKLKNVLEKDFSQFDDQLLNSGDNILLEGFFPCYRYFEPIRDVLLTEFKTVDQMTGKNAECLQRIKSTNSVSIHFRRGDYNLPTFHGMLPMDYYKKAIDYVAGKITQPVFYIFSDEPDWVRQNMSFDFPTEVIDFNGDDQNYFDIELMKHCKHNIIANSGFSWWPAWLNGNENRLVVAPAKWTVQGVGKSQMIPGDWIVI